MKRCVSCNLPAAYAVKGSNEYYCEECAEVELGSLNMLESVGKKQN